MGCGSSSAAPTRTSESEEELQGVGPGAENAAGPVPASKAIRLRLTSLDTIEKNPSPAIAGFGSFSFKGSFKAQSPAANNKNAFVDKLLEMWPDFFESCFEASSKAITAGILSRLDVVNRREFIWTSIPALSMTDMLLRSLACEGLVLSGLVATQADVSTTALDLYLALVAIKRRIERANISQLEAATIRRIVVQPQAKEEEWGLWIDALRGMVVPEGGESIPQALNGGQMDDQKAKERKKVLLTVARECRNSTAAVANSHRFNHEIAKVLSRLDSDVKPQPNMRTGSSASQEGSEGLGLSVEGHWLNIPAHPPKEYGVEIVCGSRFRWMRGGLVGFGAQGKVYKAWDADVGAEIAIKEIDLVDQGYETRAGKVEREISIMSSMRHPYVTVLLGTERTNSTMYIMMEYADGGSLNGIAKKRGGIPEPEGAMYISQLLLGLEYLHNSGILHRDIKGANCLLFPGAIDTDDNIGDTTEGNSWKRRQIAKLADFGASLVFETLSVEKQGTANNAKSVRSNSVVGTVHWMAPEVIKGQGVGRSADVWSFGCTILEALTGRPPWADIKEPVTIFWKVCNTDERPRVPNSLSADARDIIMQCLARESSDRPTARKLTAHRWLRASAMEARTRVLRDMSSELSGMNPDGSGINLLPALHGAIAPPKQASFNTGRRSSSFTRKSSGQDRSAAPAES